MKRLKSIDLSLFEKLQDKEFRDAFFEQEFFDDNALGIRALRKTRKMRQIDVANASGMKQSAISRIEQAEYSSWNCKTLLRLAQALDAKLTIAWTSADLAIEKYKTIESSTENLAVLKAREQALTANDDRRREVVNWSARRPLDRPSNQPKTSSLGTTATHGAP